MNQEQPPVYAFEVVAAVVFVGTVSYFGYYLFCVLSQ